MSGAFTPAPWMAAAGPSSVVGWPVVQQGRGRSICTVSYLPRDANAEVYAESEANARLIAAAPDLFEALAELVEQLNEDGMAVSSTVMRAQSALHKANPARDADILAKALGK